MLLYTTPTTCLLAPFQLDADPRARAHTRPRGPRGYVIPVYASSGAKIPRVNPKSFHPASSANKTKMCGGLPLPRLPPAPPAAAVAVTVASAARLRSNWQDMMRMHAEWSLSQCVCVRLCVCARVCYVYMYACPIVPQRACLLRVLLD